MAKRNRTTLLLVVAVVLTTAFIFSNSLKNSEASHASSNGLLAWVRPLLLWAFGPEADLSYLLRKGAHFAEFAFLGVWVGSLSHRFRQVGYGLFYLLAVAVTDEFLQSFTDRTSSISDVWLDFAGGVCGLAAIGCLLWLVSKRKRRWAE